MSIITANLQAVRERIHAAQKTAERLVPQVRLVAVSKGFPAAAVVQAVDAGQYHFGENYVQEALEKIELVKSARPAAPVVWEFIGPIQSNKTRAIAEHFDWVHSVDRIGVARRLSEQRKIEFAPLNVLIQVNIDGEAGKSGIAPDQLRQLAGEIVALPRLRLRGLMTIPAPGGSVDEQRRSFAALAQLAQPLVELGIPSPELSMGMSADVEAAIAEGASIVRIGTAIFGERSVEKTDAEKMQ
jgi:pyridoxal phosphate enzyme (YggS family)